jgi:hypothetical protein
MPWMRQDRGVDVMIELLHKDEEILFNGFGEFGVRTADIIKMNKIISLAPEIKKTSPQNKLQKELIYNIVSIFHQFWKKELCTVGAGFFS